LIRPPSALTRGTKSKIGDTPFCLATVPAFSGAKGDDREQPAGRGGGGADGVHYTMAFL